MAVKLRLKRVGRRNRACFRLGAFDHRTRRDGRAIEELGWYDPLVADNDKKVALNRERIAYWLSVGAKPSPTVESLLLQQGIDVPGSGKRRALSPEERAERERIKAEKKKKRELALQRKAAQKATQAPMSKKERREAKKAGG
ncbi:MAG: 30S ribosomal protein S16 [Planctomycetota bacterium]|nr:MAG: 30S ribosomal protein S16 [Planctomycetota bacterium]